MTEWSSAYTIGQGVSTLDMTYAGSAIPTITFDDHSVLVQERPDIATTIPGLEFFVSEALFWNGIVEGRLPTIHRLRGETDASNGVTFSTIGMEERTEAVTVEANISGVDGGAVHISLSWDRISGVVLLGSRPSAKMHWEDWEWFLDIHRQFLTLVRSGRR